VRGGDFPFFRQHLYHFGRMCAILSLLSASPERKGVRIMYTIGYFFLSVVAGVIANRISKWLDSRDETDN